MKHTVLKFGGTSLGTTQRINCVLDIIKDSMRSTKVVTVVSAMSALKKSEGTTSKLIQAKDFALSHGQYIRIIDELMDTHVTTTQSIIQDKNLQDVAIEEIDRILKKLKSFLKAVEVIHEITPRVEDVIIGTGEKLSACIIANALSSRGVEADYLDLSGLIEANNNTEPDQAFFECVKARLRDTISKAKGVPVLTGFIGFIPKGLLQTIGRGYTDFTAGLTAAALDALELQIWKEVDGLFTSDPNKIKNARVIERVSAAEASEITYYGSEVVHPMTMEQVIRANIPIRIKNTFRPDFPGTVVYMDEDNTVKTNKPLAVTSKGSILVINISSNRMLHAPGFMYKVFEILNRHRIVIDLIATSEVSISMTIDKKHDIQPAIAELKSLGEVSIKEDLAIISLVGSGMKHAVGTSAKLFQALSSKGINIEMISQGASEINISCLIAENHVLDALQEIHDRLLA